MFNPRFRTTPYLINLLEQIAAESAVIKSSPIQIPVRIGLEKDAVNRNVHSSTLIEGNRLSLAQVAALSEKKDVTADQKQKQEVRNYIHALRWVLKSKKSRLTQVKLLKLHRLIVKTLLPLKRAGCYRDIQNYIVNAKNIVIFTPPPPQKVAGRMRELFDWLKYAYNEHAIIRSAIFHHAFVTIHPFTDGNGRVARAAGQWLLFERGFEPTLTLGLDEYFANDRSRYYEVITQARDLDYDYTHWIEYVAEGMLHSAQNASKRLKEMVRGFKGKKIALTPKQEEVLNLLKEKGTIRSSEICKAMNVKRARVNQLIAPLVKAGLIVKEGKTRGVTYILSP